jgi:small subunit ribosomal protein S17
MRTKKGTVTSAKMQKTVTVTVTRLVMHPKYRKRYPVSKKFLADTGDLQGLKEGDTVLIGETKPLSKRKHFTVLEILASGPTTENVSLEDELSSTLQ